MLLEKPLSDTGEIIQAAFEVIHPGNGNAYTEHPITKKYLEGTTMDFLLAVQSKDCEMTFGAPVSIFLRLTHERHGLGNFGHGTINCMDSVQVETFVRLQKVSHCSTMMLGKTSEITFACSRGGICSII